MVLPRSFHKSDAPVWLSAPKLGVPMTGRVLGHVSVRGGKDDQNEKAYTFSNDVGYSYSLHGQLSSGRARENGRQRRMCRFGHSQCAHSRRQLPLRSTGRIALHTGLSQTHKNSMMSLSPRGGCGFVVSGSQQNRLPTDTHMMRGNAASLSPTFFSQVEGHILCTQAKHF